MKLIDLLVKELPKSGGWPADAVTAIYFSHKQGVTFYDKDDMGIKNGVSFICMDINGVRREEVTKEEFEAALAKNDGWIEWGGGGCPVTQGTLVDVRYRCGKENHHVKAGIFGDDSGSDPEHHAGYWGGYNSQWDIIAYRLHKPDINSRAKDDRLEQDLNECIGQDGGTPCSDAPFPPEGIEIEYSTHGQKAWYRGIVTACGESMCIVKNLSGAEQAFHKFDIEFRPLRTESEKAMESAKHIIADLCRDSAINGHSADLIMEAIAAGKIPGVKLENK